MLIYQERTTTVLQFIYEIWRLAVSDRHNVFGEPGRGRPAPEQKPRIPFVPVKDGDDDGGAQRPPRQGKRRRIHLIWIIAADVLIAALIMLLFYITNYVAVPENQGIDLPVPTAITNTATPAPTTSGTASSPAASTQVSAAPPTTSTDQTSWRAKFPDKFTTGEVVKDATSYKSGNINVTTSKVQKDGVTYFVADIYVADLKYFRTALPQNKWGTREATDVVGKENKAVIAINGDHCVDNPGPVVRNGKLYRAEKYADALVLNYDGTMQTFTADQLDIDKIKAGTYPQVWTFGPMLLKDGQPTTQFNSNLGTANPRTAVGYYEPGHYCFVVVDGRQPGYSDGYTFEQLSQLFYSLGCKVAFNLDGGQSSEMAFQGSIINKPYNGGRSTTDILYIADE
jgi:exopolysaccharide biosynthesis protein